MRRDLISNEELLYIVAEADTQLFKQGMEIKQRYLEVPRKVMRDFGYISYVMAGIGKPTLLERIETIFASIYRKQDIAMGGHIGVFMYRDIFARIMVPIVFGQVQIKPFEFVDLTPTQLRIIQTEPEEMAIYLDQFCDVFDIQEGAARLKPPFSGYELVQRYIGLARLHLHAAAAIVTGGYDYRGAVQSALLASELALKAGVTSCGLGEEDVKERFGHRLIALVDFLQNQWTLFDHGRVRRTLSLQPQYVANRYSAVQPRRVDVGHTVMGAQYIVAEVIRHISDQNFRLNFTEAVARHYPR